MKKTKYHIIQTWMLILCFVAGQYIVYSHHHAEHANAKPVVYHHSNTSPQQIITENCRLCDAMHHNSMVTFNHAYFAPVMVMGYFYKAVNHHFITVSLVLSAGRSPPII